MKNKTLLPALLALSLLAATGASAFAQNNTPHKDLKEDEMKDVFQQVDHMPAFNGDWVGYLQNNLIFPESVREDTTIGQAGLNERIVVQFIVCEDGGLCNLKVVKGSKQFPELEAEALRVLRKSPPWKPGQHNGKKVKTYFTQPIVFRMD